MIGQTAKVRLSLIGWLFIRSRPFPFEAKHSANLCFNTVGGRTFTSVTISQRKCLAMTDGDILWTTSDIHCFFGRIK